jgi:predicted MPP superfamily phosphohydrolase
VLDVAVPGLPAELAGLRIAHLSDFHLGFPGRGETAVRKALRWVRERRPDLVLVTGDLVTRSPGERRLEQLLGDLPPLYAVLGNHDLGISRDPSAQRTARLDLGEGTLLNNEAHVIELRGRRVQVVGVNPRRYARTRGPLDVAGLADPTADLRIFLCHFPGALRRVPPGAFHLVLAGHMHDGQICIPYPGGKLRLAHPSAPFTDGLYRSGNTLMHVSPGLGTTFVPFRFFARPEATELVLDSAGS